MFSEWPSGEPEQDNNLLLQEVEANLVQFLRSVYIKDVQSPWDLPAGVSSMICSN
jgi:hypothetical protein